MSTATSISSSSMTSSGHPPQQQGIHNNNINIAESLSEASSSLIPSRHQHQLQQIQVHEWQPDEAADSCSICVKQFTFWIRKHHCRKCGRVVCNSCSLNEITYLPSTYVVCPPTQIFLESPHVPHRTCDQCYEEIEMIRSALNDSLHLGSVPVASSSTTNTGHQNSIHTDDSSIKDISVSRTLEIGSGHDTGGSNHHYNNNRTSQLDEDSFKDRCPVCNKFIGCYAESQREDHINSCLVNLEFSGSPKQQRTNNRMLVYRIPDKTPSSPIVIPSIDANLESSSFERGKGRSAPSTSMDTLTARLSADQYQLSSSAKSGTSTLNTSDEKLKDEEGESECVICFEEFEPGDKVARMECLCVFHYRCIKDWFKKKGESECPVHTLHYD